MAHADAAAEYPAVALTLDATLDALSPRGPRSIAAADFFSGIWTTALEPDELLTAITFPVWEGRCGFAVQEFARRHGDFAIAGALIALQVDDGDKVSRCSIGLIGLGSTPERAHAAEEAALGTSIADIDADDRMTKLCQACRQHDADVSTADDCDPSRSVNRWMRHRESL